MRGVTETVSVGFERVEGRIGLRQAFQGELFAVIDKLLTTAVAEADAAAESARAAGQTALDAALIELEQAARQSEDLTKSVRQFEIQIEELRLALHVEREIATTAAHKCEQEHSARARAEAASDEAHRLRERLVSEYESKLQAAQTELDAERARNRGLKRQLEAQVSERAKLLTALKTAQRVCALAEANSDAFEVSRLPAEERPDHETKPHVHNQSAATTCDDHAGANDRSATESQIQHTAPSGPTGSKAGRKLKFVGPDRGQAVEVPPTLEEYAKQLFPREPAGTDDSSGVKTEEGTTRRPSSRTYL